MLYTPAIIIMDQLDKSFEQFDPAFRQNPQLCWLPWVGQRFAERPQSQRLLVVGESHYYKGSSIEEREVNRLKWRAYPAYTRDIVEEQLIAHEWPDGNKTLDTIPKLLFKTPYLDQIDHLSLWADSAYYNLVQRMMDFDREVGRERPTAQDYIDGWKTFAEIIKIIQPSHCLFIGVTAANYFYEWLNGQSEYTGKVNATEKIGGTWARAGRLNLDSNTTELIFVKHLGMPFNWSKWHEYLQNQHCDLMNWLGDQRYLATNSRPSHG